MLGETDMEIRRLIYDLSQMFDIDVFAYCTNGQFHFDLWFTDIVRNYDDESIMTMRNMVKNATMINVINNELTIRGLIA